jgi:RNA polymerase sigma-70 factor (ECF subfamily)
LQSAILGRCRYRSETIPVQLRDRELLARIRSGDPDGWRDLYDRHGSSVYRFALRRLRNTDDAEEVRQDVFLQVLRCLDRFEGRSSLSTWILGIANHEVANRIRARIRRGRSLEHRAEEPVYPIRIDHQVDARRVLDRCADLVAREGSHGQRVIVLRQWRGGAVSDVARSVGKSPQAVKTALFRTRRWLVAEVPALAELLSA